MKTAAIIGVRLRDGKSDYFLLVRGKIVARFPTVTEAGNACRFARDAEKITIPQACRIMRAICEGEWENEKR